MRSPDDLHPDDLAMRLMLRDVLTYHREKLRWSQRELGRRMSTSQSAASLVESGSTWLLSTVQRWTHALGKRPLLRPVGLPVELDPAMAAFRPTDPVQAREWDRAEILGVLADARRAMGVTQVALGDAMGISDRSVAALENPDADVLLVSLQRYCRGLGGALWVGVA